VNPLFNNTGILSVNALSLPVTGATVATVQNTSSTAYTDLGTVGPAVTVTTGTSVFVVMCCGSTNTLSAGDTSFMSFSVSGATTIAASDANSAQCNGGGNEFGNCVFLGTLVTGLTPGSNTFTAKYRVDASTWSFYYRHLTVFVL